MTDKEDRIRIAANVVTYNRKELLIECLTALLNQTYPLDAIYIIDNASTDGTPKLLRENWFIERIVVDEEPMEIVKKVKMLSENNKNKEIEIHYVRMSENTGSSGGQYEGVKRVYERGYDWLWLMDDDVVPDEGCLYELLEVANLSQKKVIAPQRRFPDGKLYLGESRFDAKSQQHISIQESEIEDRRYVLIDAFSFEGPLIYRSVVDRVGLPNRNLFILVDDTQYAARIFLHFGPLSCAYATGALMIKKLFKSRMKKVHSKIKKFLTGNGEYFIWEHRDCWKEIYRKRNLYLLYHTLGWQRKKWRFFLVHLKNVIAEPVVAFENDMNWKMRAKYNLQAMLLGMLNKDKPFIDLSSYFR